MCAAISSACTPESGKPRESDAISRSPPLVADIEKTTINCDCCPELKYCKKKGTIPEIVHDLINRILRIKSIIKDENPLLKARLNILQMIADNFHKYIHSHYPLA